MIAGIVSMWVVRVSLAYFLTFTLGLGPNAVWFAQGADFIARGILFQLRWKSGRWQGIRLI
jgi:Na+-driven multidrug efflux pump